ncbi:zinc-binding protein A33-like [Pempheris klunzingeri]|uniref:zinc-binding protein A33-like n=1 Tax=Pempheris klunzingeri TaxID=3127111 RepID=UPI00397F1BCF
MAMASSFLSEDQFMCSICLDVFTEPVSIPCGHNFCEACISKHREGKEQCQCPLCNKTFNKDLKLCVNTAFREVVENFKKCERDNDNSSVKPGQVPCDCCLGNKIKASKTCLVCLTSYCETHLEPHRRVATLKRHKLTNPVHNLEDKICKKHNKILELFCRNDLTSICVQCTEHSGHETVPLDEAYVDKRAWTGKKKAEVQVIKQKGGKKAQKAKVAVQNKATGKDESIANSVGSNQMQAPHIWWIPIDVTHQFNQCFCIPENMGFSEGRLFYEVQANGRSSWDLGVVRKSRRRRRTFTRHPSDEDWIIRLENNTSCMALHHDPVHSFLIRKPERVVVFVDYDNGLVSFFDADTEILIYSLTGCKFNEGIFLFFCPTEECSWAQRLRKKIQKMIKWSHLSEVLCWFIFMGIFLILICIEI